MVQQGYFDHSRVLLKNIYAQKSKIFFLKSFRTTFESFLNVYDKLDKKLFYN